MRNLLMFLLPLICSLPANAQTTAAQITGRITDASGSVVQGATVKATKTATEVSRETTSNELGNYTVPLLEPGVYRITVQKPGFRAAEREGVTLHVNAVVVLDFVMSVGAVSESISVKADVPLLQPAESTLNAIVDNKLIRDLPLNGRNPFDLVFLASGTQQLARPSYPGNNIPLSNLTMNGGPAMTNEILLDGIPDTAPQYNQFAIIPSIDAVQEFEVKTNNMAAEFGRTGGGVVNLSMRSGTNGLHGTLYEFLRNDAFDSNGWVRNRTGQHKPPFRYNQFGATVGGPIRKDKTFFFFDYEGLRNNQGLTYLFSVPTLAQRRGDFSQTRAQNGQLIQVFDPLAVHAAGTGYQRDQFPGNAVPASRFNEVSKNILPFWAQPNLPGDAVTEINNFIATGAQNYKTNQTNSRIDHSFSNANRLFGRFSWNESWVVPPNVFGNIANPASGPQLFTQRNLAINDTHSFSPTTFATLRVGFTRYRDHNNPLDTNFDSTQLGFPAYFRAAQPAAVFPSISVTGYTVSNIGFGTSSVGPVSTTIINNISNSYTAQSDVTLIRGKHVVKAGGDSRLFRSDGFRPNAPSFSFSSAWTQGPNPLQGSATAGQSFASYLLGLGASGNAQVNATQDAQSYYIGAFVQDQYKLTSRLTLNIGLRYEVENLRNDRYNRLNFIDFSSPSPLQAPGVRPLVGGLGFVGVNGNSRQQANVAHNWAPRLGFAYQWNAKTVVRGGYGIFVAPRTGWDFNLFGQTGFSSVTNYVSSTDGGITPAAYYSNPFPNGFVQPTGSSLGLLTNVGGGIQAPDRDQKGVYMQQWNFSVQRQLPGDIGIDIAYAGNKGTHLWQDLQYNQLPDRQLALGTALQRVVPNPFSGIVPASQPLGGATTTYGQLLRPYPQFTGLATYGSTAGSSIYNALEVRAQKRLSHGLNFLVSYMFTKMIDDGAPGSKIAWIGDVPSFQNYNDRRNERSINSQMGPQRLSIAAGYDLPFGRGKAVAGQSSRLADKFIGGWQINTIASLMSGIPLTLTCAVNNTNSYSGGCRPNSTGQSARLSGPVDGRLARFFDTSAFTQPEPFTFGNVSRTLPNVLGPKTVNIDLSLFKNIPVTERIRLQFRAEAFNAFNNVNFAKPGTAFGSTSFGVIGSAGAARVVQLALKLYY